MTHFLGLWALWHPKSFLIFWVLTFVISWVLQRTCFKIEGRVPRSAFVLVLIIINFIPLVNVILSGILFVLDYWMRVRRDFSHFYLLRKKDHWFE